MIGNRNLLLYHTEDKSSLALQLHHCGMQHCVPNYSFHISMRPYHIIHFVLDGNGTFVNSSGSYHLQKGQAFFIPAGSSSYYKASHNNPWKYCWIGVYADNANPYLKYLFEDKPIININMDLLELEKLILSIISITDSRIMDIEQYKEHDFPGEQFIPITLPSQALEANSKLLHLFSRLLETQTDNIFQLSSIEDHAVAAKSFMDEHFSEPIKVQDVANALHIHPNYLSQIFHDKYNQSPKAYFLSFFYIFPWYSH